MNYCMLLIYYEVLLTFILILMIMRFFGVIICPYR